MSDPLLFIILLLAVACGWLLGRVSAGRDSEKKGGTQAKPSINKHYVAGVNFLLNDQPDGAIEAFISSLEVNSETIETHLAIGKLSRKQGETDRAIKVHQNLLARPSLTREQRQLVQYELALDYHAAGWLDRAERILKDLLEQSSTQRESILPTLIDIYEQEKEWSLALPLAKELVSTSTPKLARRYAVSAAHYCCEMAELAQEQQRFNDSLKILRSALQLDKQSVRASILSSRALLAIGKPKKALASLKRLVDQEDGALVEAIPELRQTFDSLGNPGGMLKLLLGSLHADSPSSLVLTVFEELYAHQGEQQAVEFLEQRFHDRTSLRGLSKLLEHSVSQLGEGAAADVVSKAQEVLSIELAERPQFSCVQCAFEGQHRHWRCPGCKNWGSVRRV